MHKSIFITGAASGIGLATAKLFHQEGWFVGCHDIDIQALDELEKNLGDRCHTAYLDVRNKENVDACMAEFAKYTNGHLDVMFNNAGVTAGGFFDEMPFDKIEDIVNINFLGVLHGTYAAIPLLKKTENSLCFTTSSSAAIYSAPGMAAYCATKFAVKGFTQSMSVELARHGVRVSDVMPGIIDTPLWKSNRYVAGEAVSTYAKMPARNANRTDAIRTIAPSNVAAAVWEAYHGDRVHWYVPPELEENTKNTLSDEKRRDQAVFGTKK